MYYTALFVNDSMFSDYTDPKADLLWVFPLLQPPLHYIQLTKSLSQLPKVLNECKCLN